MLLMIHAGAEHFDKSLCGKALRGQFAGGMIRREAACWLTHNSVHGGVLMIVNPLMPALLILTTNLAGVQQYTLVDLGTLGGAQAFPGAGGINTCLHVVGAAMDITGEYRPFVWIQGEMIDLGTFGGPSGFACGINESGRVVGFADTSGNVRRGFLWDVRNGLFEIGALGGATDESIPQDINAIDEVVGGSTAGGSSRVFLWLPRPNNGLDSGLHDLGLFGQAYGVNDLGQIVGSGRFGNETHAFIWLPTSQFGLPAGFSDLGLPGCPSNAQAINAKGEIVGSTGGGGANSQPFVWLPRPAYGLEAGMNILPNLPGGQSGGAIDINDDGLIIGASVNNGTSSATVWQNGVPVNLNDLIPASPETSLRFAAAINKNGVITAGGTTNGINRTFLLQPLPDCQPNGRPDGEDIACGLGNKCDGIPGSGDCDLNQVPDECDPDSDSDNAIDGCDNCPQHPNKNQEDADSDGIGDACDPCPEDNPNDSDMDGICESSDICPGFNDSVDEDADGTPDGCDACPGFDDAIDSDGDALPDGCDFDVPEVLAVGGRYLRVTPALTSLPVAIRVTSPDWPCMERHVVTVDGQSLLIDPPVFQSVDDWGALYIGDSEIRPNTTYHVQADYGTTGAPLLSPPVTVTTWAWGDVDNNTIANFADVQLIVLAFQGDFSYAADLDPCVPNGNINFADIQQGVFAFQEQSFDALGCSIPCL